MNYHFFPELVCKTKKKRPFYIDHMLKAPRGKVRALFSNSLSTTSLICPYNWPAYLLGFLFYLLRQSLGLQIQFAMQYVIWHLRYTSLKIDNYTASKHFALCLC